MATKSRAGRRIDYIVGGTLDGILLYVVYQLPRWAAPVITDAYPAILWAVVMSLAVQVLFYLVLLLFAPLWLHHLAQLVFAVFGAIALVVVVKVFPFDFRQLIGQWLDTGLRIVLYVALGGTAIGGVVHLVRFLGALRPAGGPERTVRNSGSAEA